MHKLFKRISVLMMAVIATVCVAAFAAACGDKEDDGEVKYATDTFVVTVLDENGNAIDGTTFGDDGYGGKQVRIQFCAPNGACTAENPPVGTDGKATINLAKLQAVAEAAETTKLEMHVLLVEKKGYEVAYGEYEVDKIPTEITVTLKKA